MDVTNPVSRKLPAFNTKGLSAAYGRILGNCLAEVRSLVPYVTYGPCRRDYNDRVNKFLHLDLKGKYRLSSLYWYAAIPFLEFLRTVIPPLFRYIHGLICDGPEPDFAFLQGLMLLDSGRQKPS